MKTLFLGGGAYCFQRHMQFAYPGHRGRRRRDRPGRDAAPTSWRPGCRSDTTIKTYWGDARQFVELHQDTKKYDLIFGDAFNDFSVPWHLTTREFNEKLKKMLTPDGVYMINIIDVYESDAEAKRQAEKEIEEKEVTDEAEKEAHPHEVRREGPPLRRLRRRLDQDGQADLRQGPRLHLRDRRPGRGAPRDVRGGRVDEAARPQGPGPPQGRSPVSTRRSGRQTSRSPTAEDDKAVIERPLAGHHPDRRLSPRSRTCSPPSPRPAATSDD